MTAFAPTAADLELREALDSVAAGQLRPSGSGALVPLYVIRPGIGRGKGRHLYEADMLQREVGAGRFKDWKMYIDHQSPEAKKRSLGLPRSMRDLAGYLKEVWWDPSVPADPARGHDQGAVVGMAKVNRFMRELIEDLPEAIGASVSATATGVRPVNRQGVQALLVEGICDRGSVDFVTEAGAGGKVINVMESLQESLQEDEEVLALLESRTDEEILSILREERPDLLPRLADLAEADGGNDDDEEMEALVKKHMKKFRGNRKMAERAAKRELEMKESHEGGDTVDDLVEAIEEALEDDNKRAALKEALSPVVAALFEKIAAPALGELVEAALEDERELMQSELTAVTRRELQIRELEDVAHERIREAPLQDVLKEELYETFAIVGGKPTAALDVVDVVEGSEVKKPAQAVLLEAVDELIAKKKRVQDELGGRTRVRGQGRLAEAAAPKPRVEPADVEGDEGEDGAKGERRARRQPTSGSAKVDKVNKEAGVESVEEAEDMWDGILNGDAALTG